MGLNVETIEIGDGHAVAFEHGAPFWAIVLPGAGYSAQAPLLWYARRAAMDQGRNVLVVTDAYDRENDEAVRWVEDRVAAALSHVRTRDEHPLLIAKSLTSLAAPLAAAERLPAVWLTPLMAEAGTGAAPQVLAGLRASTEPMLLVGGSADPSWDGGVAATLANAEVLELAGADHSLEAPDDVARSLDNLRRVTDAVSRFVERLDQSPRAAPDRSTDELSGTGPS